MKNVMTLAFLIVAICIAPLAAQEGTDIESAALAVERTIYKEDTAGISRFIDQYMAGVEDREAFVEKIMELRTELEGLGDDIGLDLDGTGAILTLTSRNVEKRLRIKYNHSIQRITDIFILSPEESLTFNLNHLDSAVQYMKDQDMAGLVYIKSGRETLFEKPFGMANEALGVPNSSETIFAIGSRPIDFTIAAILLLDQEGILNLDDPLGRHLENVPPDKQAITLRHLMSGESGLPDFFDNEEDWDPDLQWVSREEAIQRMLKQTLLFEPGKGNSHSHGAFGLLAAIVEQKSEKSYIEFLNENFFEPAGISRTGEFGDNKDFEIIDFAVGGGPQFVGLPNIPPNWGPTSWLIKGSGGMYSTLDDLLKFYALIREGTILDAEHARFFKGASIDLDGSMRGFELFSAYKPPDQEIFLFLNKPGDPVVRSKVFRAFEELID